jgi:3-hydroxymyristoyl/3-hydroxydecanoyl-(acyl carrier protein) dehydratase
VSSREFELQIDPAHPALPGHFPGNPIVPAVVILAELEAAINAALGGSAELTGLPSVKFLAPLRPGERCRIALQGSGATDFRFALTRDGQAIATGLVTVRATGT